MRDDAGYMRGYKKDQSGNMVHSKLETGKLETLASTTGGKFYAASTNEGEVEEIVSDLTGLNRSEGIARRVMVYDEIYQYPLALALVCAFLMLGLSERKVRSDSRLTTMR
jgi:Ca-activated chloride channel family protein